MNTDTETSPAFDHLNPWLSAAYGRASAITSRYPNIVFTNGALERVAQIAGWLAGLGHGGQRDLARKIAEDITSQFEYLNGYGGLEEGQTFGDGTAVPNLRRYMVQLGDDGTFGGFTVGWYRIVTEEEGDKTARLSLLEDRWGGKFEACRWNASDAPVRHSARFFYKFYMNGGLIYHGPGGGETFTVSVGDTRFWGIHT